MTLGGSRGQKDENPWLFSLSEVRAVLAMRAEERKLKRGVAGCCDTSNGACGLGWPGKASLPR